jgi:mRNA interferase RelE/StbE
MADYKLVTARSFEKDLRKLPDDVLKRVVTKVKPLANEPFPEGVRKPEGEENLYRLRVGDFRVIYSVNKKEKVVDLIYVRNRKDVYKGR